MAITGLGILFISAGCSVFGINQIEEADYDVVVEDGNFELREYAPQVVAQTSVEGSLDDAGDVAFRRLFRYISGNNVKQEKIQMTAPVIGDADSGEKIEMTAPVVGENQGSSWTYQFVLPSSYTLESAPVPDDESVSLQSIPAKTVAAVRFSWWMSQSDFDEKSQTLTAWINANEWQPVSGPRWAGYNAPWTLPFLRRNEVMIDVEP